VSAYDDLKEVVIEGLKSGDFKYQGDAEADAEELIRDYVRELAPAQTRTGFNLRAPALTSSTATVTAVNVRRPHVAPRPGSTAWRR
jgi:hypothetical protein